MAEENFPKEEQTGVNKGTENLPKDEQTGFHKGALSTLAKERQELSRLLQIVEQLMKMHVKSLQDLGVDLTNEKKLEELTDEKKEQ